MSAHVLLNVFYEFRKRDENGYIAFEFFFCNTCNKCNNTGAQIFDC